MSEKRSKAMEWRETNSSDVETVVKILTGEEQSFLEAELPAGREKGRNVVLFDHTSIINHQPSIINHQSSIINHQSSTINQSHQRRQQDANHLGKLGHGRRLRVDVELLLQHTLPASSVFRADGTARLLYPPNDAWFDPIHETARARPVSVFTTPHHTSREEKERKRKKKGDQQRATPFLRTV